MTEARDRVLRAMTDDGSFRVVATRTTDMVRGATAAQGVRGAAARTFGELLTGAVLVRESMAPDLRVQAVLQGDDRRSRMVADAHPDGMTRGLVQLAAGKTTLPIGHGSVLQVARTLHNGELHQGVVEVPAGGDISAALMAYMQDSEQTVTMIAVGCLVDDAGVVTAAGGYLVQLLPELDEGMLMVMTERLKDFQSMEPLLERAAAAPEDLLGETLYGMPYTQVGDRDVAFGCTCSPARLAASLATLPRADIESMIADGKVLEIECDFCKKAYSYSPEQLRGLLAVN